VQININYDSSLSRLSSNPVDSFKQAAVHCFDFAVENFVTVEIQARRYFEWVTSVSYCGISQNIACD
jgi:hypothetical protein